MSQKAYENVCFYIVKLFIQYGVLNNATINSLTKWLTSERETTTESSKYWTVN